MMRHLSLDVIETSDGNLFLYGGRHSVFESVLGNGGIPAGSAQTFKDNICSRAMFCRNLGIKYLHLIFPDKQSALPQSFGKVRLPSLGSQLMQGLDDLSYLVFPLEILREASCNEEVYPTLDTHLSDYGTLLVFRAVMDALLPKIERLEFDEIKACISKEVDYTGDLGSKLSPIRSGRKRVLVPNWRYKLMSNGLVGGTDGAIDIALCPGAKTCKRVVIFGDSFIRGMVPLFSKVFSEVIFFRSRFFDPDLVAQIGPDIVVTSNVERYLVATAPDRLRPNIFLYPFMLGRAYNPPPDFAKYLDAFLATQFDPERITVLRNA